MIFLKIKLWSCRLTVQEKIRLLFNVCDWFFFGLTSDVKNIFNIPPLEKHNSPGREVNGKYLLTKFLGAEQYIWTSFLRKYKVLDFPHFDYFSEPMLWASEESYAKHTIMVPASLAEYCLPENARRRLRRATIFKPRTLYFQ